MTPRLRTILATVMALLFLSQTMAVVAMACQKVGEPVSTVSEHTGHSGHHAHHSADEQAAGQGLSSCCDSGICTAGGCASPVGVFVSTFLNSAPLPQSWLLEPFRVAIKRLPESPQRPPSA